MDLRFVWDAVKGQFSNEGLLGIEDDDDVLTAIVRELVTEIRALVRVLRAAT